ncbi:thioredoxin family protein [Salirhabdus sp. Marseille-P4669]|uniref:thioredoxin family protein n=1 Tax=Salirhabdus sp. Marseille-P4669 TaxID=2042310 RepID=UPI000C7BEF86|nr:thioredoxin family protein [Salirhabdus sp. Marseille-P4669]
MIEVTKDDFSVLQHHPYQFLYIYTPFCGTCQVAHKMLDAMEHIEGVPAFHSMNASLFPDFMQKHKIESVPCLAIMQKGKVLEKVYAFRSVPYLLEKIKEYN